jgi:hypothetical protein
MFEIALAVLAGVAVGKIADVEGRSALMWGIITVALCFASLAIPLPFLRVILAGVASIILLMVMKGRGGR